MTTSEIRSPSSLTSSPSTSNSLIEQKNTADRNVSSNKLNHKKIQQQEERNNLNLISHLRRPRAETMPTQSSPFSYSTPLLDRNLILDPITRNHYSISNLETQQPTWLPQSPPTPTTDQLFKGSNTNTIATSFASFGLDEHQPNTLGRPLYQPSHSYTSLQTLPEHQHHPMYYFKQHENPPYFKPEDLRSPTTNFRFSQQNRPRAMSAVDQQNQQSSFFSEEMWYSPNLKPPSQQLNRPLLRSSNSTNDILEMRHRQRKTTTNLSSALMNEDVQNTDLSTGWTGDTFTINENSSSPYDQFIKNNITLPEMIEDMIPTRSLWLGHLEITNQTANELSTIFSNFGLIESIRVLPDRECAFINFSTVEEATKAHDACINNRLLMTNVKVGFGRPEISSVASSPTTANAIASNESTQGPTRALWIGNIPTNTTQAALKKIFSEYGAIESVRVLTNKNCGFINFYSQEDAIKARRALHNQEIMGRNTGAVKIGFAKVPLLGKTNNTAAGGLAGVADSTPSAVYPMTVPQPQVSPSPIQQGMLHNEFLQPWNPPRAVEEQQSEQPEQHQNQNQQQHQKQQQMMIYMLEMMGANSNVISAVVAERKLIMQEFGEDDSDGPMLDALHLPQKYFREIPAAPELGQSRKVDISRLRDIRKRLDGSSISTKELEAIAVECVGEIVELCSDYIGNTVIQRLFEKCSETTKSMMLEAVAPYLASIGVHKNGTWAAQKIIDTAKLPAQISLICNHIKPYVPALLLDQFGNYVVQCCLGLGPNRNQFIFDAIVDKCWDIAQGRFGARAVRATLESPHVTKRQQKYVAASLVQHALLLATNANGALLLIWLLDTSGIPGRYQALAPRLLPHLPNLCTHKLASLTVLKLINQRQEPEARTLILDALFFSSSNPNEVPSLIDKVLRDTVHGVSLVQKVLSSSYIELRERQRIAERTRHFLIKMKFQHAQGYKRLMEEINMVLVDSAPGASLGVTLPGQFSINPSLAAALQAKYMMSGNSNENHINTNDDQTAAMMANFYAAAAAAAAAATNSPSTTASGNTSTIPATVQSKNTYHRHQQHHHHNHHNHRQDEQ
ncbi:Pumilio domain-containing protein C56F2.08c [Choanephora cucurbitarum]|uniref:Pumilio domain-containing protein C56F2.08c n=1 Tax=Choanephora cucurbitarum TaxID=101091 RepID=A0A1C7NED2_9FUNG|nr:Pumilio domain-containing protein C56F2.08c [Choanephora cucurbitarum]